MQLLLKELPALCGLSLCLRQRWSLVKWFLVRLKPLFIHPEFTLIGLAEVRVSTKCRALALKCSEDWTVIDLVCLIIEKRFVSHKTAVIRVVVL